MPDLEESFGGCSGLMVRYRFWGRRIPSSKPDSTEDPSSIRLYIESYVGGQTSSRWCGVEVWRGGASSGVILVIWPRFKWQGLSQNSSHAASKRDVNITKLGESFESIFFSNNRKVYKFRICQP
ncbi:hypothetical protein AVEN_55187-1 [Araneus ventricosus]|uniref:Uncharacterized protein n=1 Tax=Araneus ventricosus TaxID=182803 RepID=A0A4Y2J8N9_ARAVE|nr:hypothetical protein AVEN_55187-1 [Araneus ventricosus]